MMSERKFRFLAFKVCLDQRDYLRSLASLMCLVIYLPSVVLEMLNFTWQVVNSRRIFRGLVTPVMLLFFGLIIAFVTLLLLGDIILNALTGRLTGVYFKDGTLSDVGLEED